MLVLGDVHGERPANRRLLLRLLEERNVGTVLQLGDLGCYDLPRPVWFVAGNNEDQDVIERLRRSDGEEPEGVRNVRLVDPLVESEGLRIAGLSGNYAPTKYDTSRDELTGDRRRHFTRDEVEVRTELEDVDVFLCHEAPHGVLEESGHDVGCRPIDEILRATEPDLCLVGHHHRHAEGRFGETRVVVLAPMWEGIYHLDPSSLELGYETVDGDDAGDAGEP